MPEQTPPTASLEASIHELARVVREGRHLDPDAQQALADLVDELTNTLQNTALPAEETARLAESAAHLAQALHQRHEPTMLQQARDRLQQAVARAEVEAPVATGIARRLLDALANIGI
jgi:hypothetical protein